MAPPVLLEASATVLESPEHGPQLCLGGVATSLPPQCGGPDLIGWDWARVEGEEAFGGTIWGVYRVVGMYADGFFTLTEPPGPPQLEEPESIDFTSPCPPPEGGWTVRVPALATDQAMEAANAYAQSQPDYGGLWLDQSINPAATSTDHSVLESQMNDPTKLILNVRFTEDLEAHEAELLRLWGGALCVSLAERTEQELIRIQNEVSGPGSLWSSTDIVEGRVDLGVVFDDGTLQTEYDAKYGAGVVRVVSALKPVANG